MPNSRKKMEGQNLIFYASIAQGTNILAECLDDDPGFAAAMAESLASLPPMHKTVTFAANNRLACYLIQPPLTYCGVFDEVFGKEHGFTFLGQIQSDFRRLLLLRGLQEDRDELQNYHLDRDVLPVMRNAINDATGRQCYEGFSDQSFDDSVPLMGKGRLERRMSGDSTQAQFSSSCSPLARGKSSKHKQYELREVVMERCDKSDGPAQAMETSSGGKSVGNSRMRAQWQRMRCCCSMKFILAIDAVVCVVLLSVWLAVCRGFRC
ncbi:hypothetical protein SELMODRAFT_412990 [Selaginella moellendorffii]|uniref:Longin domain-containing protein n=1 Tax=Selaginella moellendorffii TaxID=88036 RepID=D8RN00_SELML|nr:phytolongin Phyl1.1 [Selaginella moellendorffii]EFJ26627.1 hypothetical protein SELMODRAFT_412990 [Selaginella moellendorffii]|eukprot:XP_002972541.1 phytolongin Phyl1.1 [Selaginella moellendorffii]